MARLSRLHVFVRSDYPEHAKYTPKCFQPFEHSRKGYGKDGGSRAVLQVGNAFRGRVHVVVSSWKQTKAMAAVS